MFGLLPCDAPTTLECGERFRVAASQWIDARNFGDMPPGLEPPAGIRIRWNWPLQPDVHPSNNVLYPDSFRVLRASVDSSSLFEPRPTVGHLPQSFAPKRLWRPLRQTSDSNFVVDGHACKGVQAVYIEMAAHAVAVTIALVDVSGVTRLTGELRPGDVFYYETVDLHRVSFSARPELEKIMGLSLNREDLDGIEFDFEEIASIDARAWLKESLAVVSERMTASSGPSFTTIVDQDWIELQAKANVLVDAVDQGISLPAAEQAYVDVALAYRWEIAALAGTAFLDGDHVNNPLLDRIDAGGMLAGPSGRVFAYKILAEFNSKEMPEVSSDIAFAQARPMGALTPARVSRNTMPHTKLVEMNHVDQNLGGTPVANGRPTLQTMCTSDWTLEASAPFVNRIFTTPLATPSDITGETLGEPSECWGGNEAIPPSFRGFDRIETRDHIFAVPYYDSDIWLSLAVGDSWDRRIRQSPSPRVQPDIDYDGQCLPLDFGNCAPAIGPLDKAKATLNLLADPTWNADPLASFARGEIELLLKDAELEPQEAEIQIFPPVPTADGNWRADIITTLDQTALSHFVGGTLVVAGFKARILGFGAKGAGRHLCEFEASPVCAGADLYEAGPKGAVAHLYEYDGSDRVWDRVGAITLLTDGAPSSYLATIELPPLETSMTLYFSSRLTFSFEGRTYRGPITGRIAVPYMHPAPKAPELCLSIDALATDYYGRALVRVTTTDCDHFDDRLDVMLEVAEGVIADPADFAKSASSGLFGPQAAFDGHVVFEGFDLISRLAEGSSATLGTRYYRASDSRESPPDLQSFSVRRSE